MADAPDSLTVRMEDGTVLCETVAEVPGAAARPLGTHEILRKFETCGGDRRAAETVLSAPGATPFRWSDFSRASAAAAKTCNA